MIGNNETTFPHKLLLTDRQVSSLRKSFASRSSADIKLSKTQLSKMIQSGGFPSRFLSPLLKTRLQLIKNVIKPLAKSALIPLGSGHNNTTRLKISNDEIDDIIDKNLIRNDINDWVNKKEFHISKETIDLMSVNIDQIVISDKFNHNNEGFKYFIRYQEGEIVKPLCIVLPQMSGYVKYFEYGGKRKMKWKKNANKFGM